MATYNRFGADGSQSGGSLHPEVSEASLACLKRDLRRIKQIGYRPFLRRPYVDLQEAQLIAINDPDTEAANIAGIMVVPMKKDESNARIPLTAEQVAEEMRSGEVLDLWTSKGFS